MIYVIKASTILRALSIIALGAVVDLLFGGMEPGDAPLWIGFAVGTVLWAALMFTDTSRLRKAAGK